MQLLQSLPTSDGIAESIIEVMFGAVIESIDSFATDFFGWLGGVRDPTQNSLLVDAWFAVFEISLAVLVIWIVLGLLSFPFGDDSKTDLYRFGWRIIGVFIIFAIAQPAFSFGAELSNELFQMIFTLTEQGANIEAEFNGLVDTITSAGGTAIGLLVAGVITAVMMGVAQLIIVAVMFSIDYIFWTAFVFSPLLAVFWMVDWGPLAKANDFAETMFDAAVGSLLYPVAISVFATAYVVLVGAGVQGGLNDSTLSAMLELTAMSVIFPFIILAVGFKLLSQIGNGMYGLSTVGKMAGVAVTAGAGAVVGGIQGAATAAGSGGSSALSGAASGVASGAQRGAQTIARGGMGPTNEPISSVGMRSVTGGGSGQTSRGGATAASGGGPTQNTTTNASGSGASGGSQPTTTASSSEPKRGGLIGQTTGAIAAGTPESVKSAGSTIKDTAGKVSPRPSTQYDRQKRAQNESLEATANYQETASELEQADEGDTVNLDNLKEQGLFNETEASAPTDGQGEVTVGESGRVRYQSEEGGRDMVHTDELATAASAKADTQLRKAERAEKRADIADKGKQATSGVASGMQFTGAMAAKIGMMGARDVVMGHPGYTNFSMGSSAYSGGQASGSGANGAEGADEANATERATTSVSPAYFGADDQDRIEADASSYKTLSNGERFDLESPSEENLSVVRDPEQSSESESAEVGWVISASQAEDAPNGDAEEVLNYYRQQGTRVARTGDNAPEIPTEGSIRGYANADVAEVDGQETVSLDENSGELADNEIRPAEFDDAPADKLAAVRGEYQEQPGGGAYIEGTNGSRASLQQQIDGVKSGEQTLVKGGVRELQNGSKTLDPEYQPSAETSQKEGDAVGSKKQKQKQKQQRQPNTPSGGVVPLGKQGIALPDSEKSEIAGNSVDYVGSVDDSVIGSSVGGFEVVDNTSDRRFSDDDGTANIGRDNENVAIRNANLTEQDGYYQMELSDDTVVENPSDLSGEVVEEYGNDEVEELRWGDQATGTQEISISETPPVNTLSESERAVFDGESVDVVGEVEKPEFGRRTIGGISIQDESADGRFSKEGPLKELPSVEDGAMVKIENAQYRVNEGKGNTEIEEAVLTEQSRFEILDASDVVEPSIRRGEATNSDLAVDKASIEGGSINTEEMDYVSSSRELDGMAVSATGVVDQRPSGETVLRGQDTDNEAIKLTDETIDADDNRAQIGDGALADVEPGDTVSLNQSIVDSGGEQLRLTEDSDVEAVDPGSEGVPTPTVEKDYSKERLADDRSSLRSFDANTLAERNLETAFEGGEEVSMREVTFVENEMSGSGPIAKGGRFETPSGEEISSYSQLETEDEPSGDRLQDGGTYDVNALAVDNEGRFKPSENTELSRLDADETTTEQKPDRQVDTPNDSRSNSRSSMRNSGGDTTPSPTKQTSPEPGQSSDSPEETSEKDKRRRRGRNRGRGGLDSFTPSDIEYNDENKKGDRDTENDKNNE